MFTFSAWKAAGKKGFIHIVILFCNLIAFNSTAQVVDGWETAHFRAVKLNFSPSYDTRYPVLMLKSEAEIKLLNGAIQLGGHYCFQMLKLESWDKKIIDPAISLLGDNLKRRYSAYEVYGGFNFFSRSKENIMVTVLNADGRFITSAPGSKAFQIGCRMGFGAYCSKVGIYDQPFDVIDENGEVFEGYPVSGGGHDFHTYANTISEYLFIGSNNYIATKLDKFSDRPGRGEVANIYADLILPTRQYIGKMYSAYDEVYTAVPKNGDNWKKMGYRLGFSMASSSRYCGRAKFEIGRMPVFSTYGEGPSSIYVSLDMGIGITPLWGIVKLKSLN